MNLKLLKTALVALTLCATALQGLAFSASRYASTSKLAQGRWVKIAVPTTGVYEITAEQLQQMGFSSPATVHVFGTGGNAISEVLDGSASDDLKQVPVQLIDGKLCFYAKGPVAVNLTGTSSANPRYARTFNAYSNYGYYFLTESAGNMLNISEGSQVEGTTDRATSMDYVLHEQELVSKSQTGKDLLGEDIEGGIRDFSVALPNLVAGTPIIVNPCVAGKVTSAAYVQAMLSMGGAVDTASFTISTSRVTAPKSGFTFYNYASPIASVTPKQPADEGTLSVGLLCPNGTISSCNLDYFILTYQRANVLPAGAKQMRMGFANLTTADRIVMADSNLVVWNIDNTNAPVQYVPKAFSETDTLGNTTSGWAFSPGLKKGWSQYVAFDPKAELLHIASWQEVPNQNIHADPVPDMVIITNQAFMDQAKRIAKAHEQTDGMVVNIYDQEQVYNEFSSGTPDAMAIRLMNKMFYDRDTERRFKYELMLGCGSYDNRGLATNKTNRLITYQSDQSNDDTFSFVSDDFFGMLDDNSGYDLSSDVLRLGIGRITSATPEECKADVDKLFNYIENPDYGVWRNNALVTSDQGDNTMHQFQAEGISLLVENELGTKMIANRCYNGMFPFATETAEKGVISSLRTATQAKRFISQQLKAGQYFFTYVGHAGPTTFTHDNHMWTNADVNSTSNRFLPIVSTACCDVARYDSETRGIAEEMFHKKDGGAIALLTSARSVYASSNDQLNRAFTQGIFSYATSGKMPRLGDAYLKSKQSFGTSSDYSKMSFMLLGDPAIKVNYPLPLMQVAQVNGQDVDDATAVHSKPMHTVNFVGHVLKADGSLDTDFNGNATLTIYDKKEFFMTASYDFNRVLTNRNIYYPRPVIAQVNGNVQGGVVSISAILPRTIKASADTCLVSLYAHKTGTTSMVSGKWEGLVIDNYSDDSTAVHDDQAPVINSIFMNDELSWAQSDVVAPNSTLYVSASDDVAFNTQTESVASGVSLALDGGAVTYDEAQRFATVSDGGRNLDLALPLSGLTQGRHTLTITVVDVAGNTASQSISFVVGSESKLTLASMEYAADKQATFEAAESSLGGNSQVTVKVTDATGKLVWSKTGSTLPLTWNLKDNDGKRVAPGLYRYYGTYIDGNVAGGTPISTLIVIDPVKTNK